MSKAYLFKPHGTRLEVMHFNVTFTKGFKCWQVWRFYRPADTISEEVPPQDHNVELEERVGDCSSCIGEMPWWIIFDGKLFSEESLVAPAGCVVVRRRKKSLPSASLHNSC